MDGENRDRSDDDDTQEYSAKKLSLIKRVSICFRLVNGRFHGCPMIVFFISPTSSAGVHSLLVKTFWT